ncbi:MAG: 50S ribosomal protein L20 [Hyphomicrobiales bacterium]|nr:50S ribosomal protein L20 [Hyphomicrobiales bacterium]PCH50711.1 MAG: 50S ribosomal protein L20 [Hyphomicrobiales bacterium]
MARVKRGVTSHARHKKVLKKAKGFYGARRTTIRSAKPAVDKAMQYATRDRRTRKRNFRSLWVQRINAAARLNGLTYGRLIDGMTKANIEIDRKVLSDMAIHEAAAFTAVCVIAKEALTYLKDTTPNAFESAVN